LRGGSILQGGIGEFSEQLALSDFRAFGHQQAIQPGHRHTARLIKPPDT